VFERKLRTAQAPSLLTPAERDGENGMKSAPSRR